MKKGFMRLVEVIVITLVALVVIVQFSCIPKIKSDWERTELMLQARDLLFSLDSKGIDWFNSTRVEKEMSDALRANILYEVMIINTIKPNISAGCVCNDTEFTETENLLSGFSINGLPVGFSLHRIDPANISFPHSLDVIIVYDYNLTGYYNQLQNYLSEGKGIVEVRHLDESDMDLVQQDIFGLVWNDSLNPTDDRIGFAQMDAENRFYNIYKYFYHIPRFQDGFSSGLGMWTVQNGTPEINNSAGGPAPSMMLKGTACGESVNTWVYAAETAGYADMVIYADVYINSGGMLDLTFRMDPETNTSYIARLDTRAGKYDAFLIQENETTWSYTGSNTGHTSSPGEWHRMKVVVHGDDFELYNDGVLVATASDDSYAEGYTGIFHECAEAYVDNVKIVFAENHSFSNFIKDEKISPADGSSDKIILKQENSNVPACVINYDIANENGRSAWLPGGNNTLKEREILIKDLVAFAAGYTYNVVENEIRGDAVRSSLFKILNREMFQIVEIVLRMGYLY